MAKTILKTNFFLVIMLCCFAIKAQIAKPVEGIIVKESKLNYLGKSRPVSALMKLNPTPQEQLIAMKKQKKKPDNFSGRKNSLAIKKDLEHQGADPVRQANNGSKLSAKSIVNTNGLGDFNSPHDPSGDVGPNHYVQMINATTIGVFAKDGTPIEVFAANTLWQEFGAESAGDPIVLYDEVADRWFITEFTDPANVLIAVSENGDPLGAYVAYNFSTPDFPDYPKYALWPEALVLTTNEGGAATLDQYVFDRNAMLQGSPDVTMQHIEVPGNNNTEGGFFVSTPVDWNGLLAPENGSPIVLSLEDSSWGKSKEDQINVFRININWSDATLTTVDKLEIVTSPYDSYPCAATSGPGFSCIPQKGASGIDGLPEVIMNIPHYRNFGSHESLVFSFITDATDGQNIAGIRWVELRRTATSDWALYQEGTYAPNDGLNRFMCSTAIDRKGNIGLAYNVSSQNEYVGVRYTGRNADDPLGIMSIEEVTVVDGMGPINSNGRFGDYAQMSVDPKEDVFWYTTEYASKNLESKTRIVAFLITKDSFDIAALDLVKPVTKSNLSDNEMVTATYENRGLTDIVNFTIGYSLNGAIIDSMTITDTLKTGAIGQYTFSKGADLSLVDRDYFFEVWVNYAKDNNTLNNTVKKSIRHIYANNAKIETKELPKLICDSIGLVSLLLTNDGEEPLSAATFEVTVDGFTNEFTYQFEQPIIYNENGVAIIQLPNLILGQHVVMVKLIKANGINLPVASSTTLTRNLTQMGFDARYNLDILFDKFPEENRWNIRYKVGSTLLYDVGPYLALKSGSILPYAITETICLEKDTCYRFNFKDAAANGICCNFGDGNFKLTHAASNEVKVESDGKFKLNFNANFCTYVACNLSIDVATIDDNGQNSGTISITPKDAEGPFKYSIDGGLTYSDNAIFTNLSAGTYNVVVVSGNPNCKAIKTVEIKIASSTTDFAFNNNIKISPNPNNGYFHLTLEAPINAPVRVSYNVLDANGKILQNRWMNKYNQNYESTISIVDYPSGVYYIQVLGDHWTQIGKVVKL